MISWIRSIFRGRSELAHALNETAMIRLLTKISAELEVLRDSVATLTHEMRAANSAKIGSAIDAYRDAMQQMASLSLGMSGHVELAQHMQTLMSRGRPAGVREPDSAPPDPSHDEEEWPPKGCVTVDSRG